MGKLKDTIRASKIPYIRIKYGEELLKFNLFDELRINENLLDKEVKDQPGYYGFLLLLHKKLLTRFETLKNERVKIKAQLFVKYKEKIGNGGRPLNDETVKAMVDKDKKFQEITEQCIKARDDADTIYACVRSFEQRKDLIQTLSSNNRKNI